MSAAGGITVAPGTTWILQGLGAFLLGTGGKNFQRRMGGRCWFRWRGRSLIRSWLWERGWFRKAVRGGMWWNLFSSNPCRVCHRNRFYFSGICWPLMGWVFTLPEMVPVSQQRSQRFFFGGAETCTGALSISAAAPSSNNPKAAAARVSPGPRDQETTCLQKTLNFFQHLSSSIARPAVIPQG